MDLQLSSEPDVPLYRRIADAVCAAVISGQVAPGEKLPAHLGLARQYGVSPLTVSRGYELLASRGIVRQRRGSGTYVEVDALQRLQRDAQRAIASVALVVGENSLSRCRRETMFILTARIEGMLEVLGEPPVRLTFHAALTQAMAREIGRDDAVVVMSPTSIEPGAVEALLARNVPVLEVGSDRPLLGSLGVTRIAYDKRQAPALACDHLVSRGFRRIGFIGVKSYRDQPISPKFYVYTSLLHEAGLDICARHVREASVDPGRAYAAARDILEGGDLPEAFFVDTDYKAMEVITALRDAGLRVPQDVAIVSYDDVAEAATFDPPLTTVRTPHREIGRQAAQMLLAWPPERSTPQETLLTSQLIVRRSCGSEVQPPLKV